MTGSRFASGAAMGALVLAVVGLGTAVAAAQPTPEMLDSAARIHFDLGTQHYAAGRFGEAAVEFREAYRLSQRPALLYNVHLSERDAGRPRESLEALRQYLASDAEIPNRAALEGRAAAMEREIAAAEAAATRADVEPSRGAGATATATEGERGGGAPLGGWLLAGGGAMLLVAATVTGVLALSADADLADRCPAGRCTDAEAASDIDRGATLALATDVLGGIGIVALAVGIAVLALGSGAEANGGARRAGDAWAWRF